MEASHEIHAPTGIPSHEQQSKQLNELLVLMKAKRDARIEQENKTKEQCPHSILNHDFLQSDNHEKDYGNSNSYRAIVLDSCFGRKEDLCT